MNSRLMIATSIVCLAGSIPLAWAQPGGAGTASTKAKADANVTTAANNRDDANAIEALQAAAQRLRDAIHAMADAPAGPKRNEAIRAGNKALAETQAAMANLPSDLLIAGAKEGDYQKAMGKLKQAGDSLRDASHALAKEPAGERRNAAMKKVNQALLQTNQTMIDLPLRTSRK